jgi:3-hydroxybutyryl-CoA dehydrogenase
VTRCAVVGCGLMGRGIAQVLASARCHVRLHDPVVGALEEAPGLIAASLRELGADGSAIGRLSRHTSLADAVDSVEWVFEAAPEKLELKRDIFGELDRLAPTDAILATNTSVISVGEIAAQASRRGRVLGTHWWNPAYLVPLVEVVQGSDTETSAVQRTIDFLTTLGKTPVHVKRDVPGFVGNRLQHALWREAFNLIDDGVCDAATVDTVVKAGFGLRLPVLGPVETADLVGLDLALDIHEYILPRLDPPSQPSAGLRKRVSEGHLGMSTGRGFREWTPTEADDVRTRLRSYLQEVGHA